MQSAQLLQSLEQQTREITREAEQLKALDLSTLSRKENPSSWNILECLEHLNLYGDYYLPEIGRKITNAKAPAEPEFKPGLIGNYFAKSMLPGKKMAKMKTFKDKNPLGSTLGIEVIDRFVEQQGRLLHLLETAGTVSLNKVKITTSISKLVRLKLGDTFRFYINHIIRHMEQVKRIRDKND